MFDINGRDVSAAAAGALLSASSTYGYNTPGYGGDLWADAPSALSNQAFVNTACAANATSDWYEAAFPPAPGFPGGLPVRVSVA